MLDLVFGQILAEELYFSHFQRKPARVYWAPRGSQFWTITTAVKRTDLGEGLRQAQPDQPVESVPLVEVSSERVRLFYHQTPFGAYRVGFSVRLDAVVVAEDDPGLVVCPQCATRLPVALPSGGSAFVERCPSCGADVLINGEGETTTQEPPEFRRLMAAYSHRRSQGWPNVRM